MKTFITIALVIGLCGVLVRKAVNKKKITSSFNDDEIQRIQELRLSEVVIWADRKLKNYKTDSDLEINILPNKATLEALKGQLKLTPNLLKKSYLILILDKANNKVLHRKLAIADNISGELSEIQNDKVFVTPLK